MFDAIEEAFDDVPSPILRAAISTLSCSIRARRDDEHLRTSRASRRGKRIGAVAFVCNHGFGTQVLDQLACTRNVGHVTRSSDQPQGPSDIVGGWMQLGRQYAERATERLWSVLFAPDECLWARTLLESINTCLISVSPAWIARSHTPLGASSGEAHVHRMPSSEFL